MSSSVAKGYGLASVLGNLGKVHTSMTLRSLLHRSPVWINGWGVGFRDAFSPIFMAIRANKKLNDMGILKTFFTNCAHPRGMMGRMMLRFMNFGHAPLTNWGLDLVEFQPGWNSTRSSPQFVSGA